MPSLDTVDAMIEEKIIALFDALKQIHATALELLDSPDLPDHAKQKVLGIVERAETALNAQNKEETPDTEEN